MGCFMVFKKGIEYWNTGSGKVAVLVIIKRSRYILKNVGFVLLIFWPFMLIAQNP
jgi:hypothetical protein